MSDNQTLSTCAAVVICVLFVYFAIASTYGKDNNDNS